MSHNKGSNHSKLLFFTCATGFYENFIIPYIYFALKNNPDCSFEFLVDDRDQFLSKHNLSLEWLSSVMQAHILIRSIPKLNIRPKMENSIRFLVEPESKADYVYIADIDIIILENVLKWHKPVFDANLPYSNIVRKGTKRLTGLHLTKFESFYPLPKIDDLIGSISNDEALLYQIVDRKIGVYDDDLYKTALIKNGVKPIRPLHGVHMSLNRLPFSYHPERVSWAIDFSDVMRLNAYFESKDFNDFYETLYFGSSQILLNLIFLSHGISSFGEKYFKKNVVFNKKNSS